MSSARPPDWPLVGLECPVTIVSGRVAHRLSPVLDEIVRSVRRRGVVLDDEVAAVLAAMRRSAHEHARRLIAEPSPVGSASQVVAETGPRWSREWLTTEEAADRLHVTARRVRQLCADGALVSERRGGRVWVDPVSIADRRDHAR